MPAKGYGISNFIKVLNSEPFLNEYSLEFDGVDSGIRLDNTDNASDFVVVN